MQGPNLLHPRPQSVQVLLAPKTQEGDSKGGNSRLAQVRKPEFTKVNEDFRGKRNAESTLLSRPLFVFRQGIRETAPARSAVMWTMWIMWVMWVIWTKITAIEKK